jgi:hypothetical protein
VDGMTPSKQMTAKNKTTVASTLKIRFTFLEMKSLPSGIQDANANSTSFFLTSFLPVYN